MPENPKQTEPSGQNVQRVFSGLKSGVKLRVLFVIFLVVAYRLLDTGMDLGAESAVAFGSRPQQ
jgi:hypothetical protein